MLGSGGYQKAVMQIFSMEKICEIFTILLQFQSYLTIIWVSGNFFGNILPNFLIFIQIASNQSRLNRNTYFHQIFDFFGVGVDWRLENTCKFWAKLGGCI